MNITLKSATEEMLRSIPTSLTDLRRKMRAWEVVHACEFARDIADVVEAQINAGMRPYLLTMGAEIPARASILQAWQDVQAFSAGRTGLNIRVGFGASEDRGFYRLRVE